MYLNIKKAFKAIQNKYCNFEKGRGNKVKNSSSSKQKKRRFNFTGDLNNTDMAPSH